MTFLVIETFLLMAAFVAIGVLIGIGLKQVVGQRRPALAAVGAPTHHGHPEDDIEAPVVVPVARPDTEDAATPVVDPIAPEEAPAEAPAIVAADVEPAPAPASSASEGPLSAAEVVIDAGRAATADQVGVRPQALAGPRDGRADDLKLIKGIGPQNEARLNALGVFHFDQIAGWSAEEARWIGSYLAFPGRIEREDWIGQARRIIGT